MKKPFQKIVVTLIAIFYVGICSAETTETFTVVSDYWCPYNCEPNSKKEGFGIEFLRAIYEPAGIKVVYSLKSWDQAIVDTRKGNFNAVISAYRTDADDFVFPENPYAYSISCFFVKPATSWKFAGVKSLEKQKIGVIKGYSYGVHIDEFITKNINSHVLMVSGAEPLDELFTALKNNRITTILEDEAVFNYMNQSKFPGMQTREAGCQYPGSLYIAFSPARPDSKKLAEIFDREFINLKRSGKYQEILKKYGIKN